MLFRHSLSVALIFGIACSGSVAQDGDDVLTASVKPVASASSETEVAPTAPSKGRITGMIKVDGEVDKSEPVDMASDPTCVAMHGDRPMLNPIGIILSDEGGLKNVFIQLTRVPDKKYDRPEEPVVVNQVGCAYEPHVWGIMKRQELKILNSDATLHNIHSMPKSNKEFNLAMPNEGDERTQKFKKAEDAIKIKCDVHPWMAMFAFVLEHPYYAVSAADGTFALDTTGLPDGEYGVKYWHEVLGEAEGNVTIEDGAAVLVHTFEIEDK